MTRPLPTAHSRLLARLQQAAEAATTEHVAALVAYTTAVAGGSSTIRPTTFDVALAAALPGKLIRQLGRLPAPAHRWPGRPTALPTTASCTPLPPAARALWHTALAAVADELAPGDITARDVAAGRHNRAVLRSPHGLRHAATGAPLVAFRAACPEDLRVRIAAACTDYYTALDEYDF